MAHKSDARKKKKKLNTETAAIPNNGMEETDCRYQKKNKHWKSLVYTDEERQVKHGKSG